MDRLRREVEDLGIPTTAEGRVVTISARVAALDITKDGSLQNWPRRTDALYRAKNAGRNRVSL